ncbi:MAG: ComF family protein [Chloroflexi bacterium]|nr:ComF family protein [Chloroflexota bacterium]
MRHAIHHYKYQDRTSLAQDLGELLSQLVMDAEIPPCAAIVPVPLHPKREAERGFNQASLLALAVSERLHLPVLSDGIVRIVDTPPQVGLSREQRLRNVAGAFSARRSAFQHGGILLLDDVATTGATLVTCAQELVQEGGAPWVWGAVLARGG